MNMTKKGFTKFRNELLEALFAYRLTDRQRRIVLLILRFTIGCQKQWIKLKAGDFALAGVYKHDITHELESLAKTNVIRWVSQEKLFAINTTIEEWNIPKNRLFTEEKLRNLLTRSLAKPQPHGGQPTYERVGKIPTTPWRNSNSGVVESPPKESKYNLNKVNKEFQLKQEELTTFKNDFMRKHSI